MFSLKTNLVAAATAAFSLALLAGCKTTKPEPAPTPAPPTVLTNIPAAPPVARQYDSGDNMAPNILAWDATKKEYHAKPGEMTAPFTFSMTNITSGPVTIYNTSTTCECTVAKLPSTPWVVPSGGYGIIEASINLTNRIDTVTNSVIISTSQGNRRLNLMVYLPEKAK